MIQTGLSARTLAGLSFLVCFAICTLVGIWCVWPFYYPSGDEIALLTQSAHMFHPHPATWFLEGFHNYFLAYPWAPPTTDFLRPVANLTYFLDSIVFTDHWAWYISPPISLRLPLSR